MNITEKYIKEAMSVEEADQILADFEQRLKSQRMSEDIDEKERFKKLVLDKYGNASDMSYTEDEDNNPFSKDKNAPNRFRKFMMDKDGNAKRLGESKRRRTVKESYKRRKLKENVDGYTREMSAVMLNTKENINNTITYIKQNIDEFFNDKYALGVISEVENKLKDIIRYINEYE